MSGLTQTQVEQFHEDGYLKVEDLLDPVEDLDPIIEEHKGVLDQLAQDLVDQGEISDTYADLPFGERFIKICIDTNETHAQYFDFSLPQGNVKANTPMWVGPAVFRSMTNPRLLDAVESIIGSEIYSNPVQHVRIKPPEKFVAKDEATGKARLGATNWHQDNGVVLPVADESDILTVWFSLTDASEEQGCLQVVPKSHRDGILTHCPAGPGGLEVPERVASRETALPLPTKRGDVLFLTKRTLHGSLSNMSDEIRWSFDLRYNPIGQETGRGAFPGFIARSRQNPDSELRDPEDWANLWYQTRAHLSATNYNEPFNRWDPNAEACA
jgi:phytanoyl-CoA hydroxylase